MTLQEIPLERHRFASSYLDLPADHATIIGINALPRTQEAIAFKYALRGHVFRARFCRDVRDPRIMQRPFKHLAHTLGRKPAALATWRDPVTDMEIAFGRNPYHRAKTNDLAIMYDPPSRRGKTSPCFESEVAQHFHHLWRSDHSICGKVQAFAHDASRHRDEIIINCFDEHFSAF